MSYKLDDEEQAIFDLYQSGKYSSVSNLQQEIEKAQLAAKNTLSKTKHISIRLLENDVNTIKVRAENAGLSYQTVISALVHQYAQGKITINI